MVAAEVEVVSGRGRILPSRRELQDRIRELETPREAAKIVIEALEQTARALWTIFLEGS